MHYTSTTLEARPAPSPQPSPPEYRGRGSLRATQQTDQLMPYTSTTLEPGGAPSPPAPLPGGERGATRARPPRHKLVHLYKVDAASPPRWRRLGPFATTANSARTRVYLPARA